MIPPRCLHEFPEGPPRVYDLAPYRDRCLADADAIDRARGPGGHRMGFQTRNARYHGELACQVYALVTGWERRVVVGRGDGGFDFPDGTDVKSSVNPEGGWRSPPWLNVNLAQLETKRAARYALAAVNLRTMEGRLWVVVSADAAAHGLLVQGETEAMTYRRLDARHERLGLARAAPGVCMICGRPRAETGPLFEREGPRLKPDGDYRRLDEVRGFIEEMRESISEREGK